MNEMLRCGRCQTMMFRSTHTEHERIGIYELLTRIVHYECPFCGVMHVTMIPGLEPQQLEGEG